MKLQIKIEGTLEIDPTDYEVADMDDISEGEMDNIRSQVQEDLENGVIELTELDYEPFTIEVVEAE